MYERIIQKALNSKWALMPSKLAIVQQILLERHSGYRPTAADIRARLGFDPEEQDKPQARKAGQIAVLPVYGVISNRSFEASSGATSAEWIGGLFRRMVASEEIGAIVLDFSSPGGTVDGVPELAAEIFAAREVKPIIAHVNSLAASAGYWLATQCSEISCIGSGEVGSIGVYSLHEDISERLKQMGVKITAIQAGDHKLDGAPWEPLSDEALAHFQGQVDACYRDFLAAVARGRGVDVATVKADFGQGWCFSAKEAKKRGMIDRIETFEQLVARLSSGRKRGAGGARAKAVAFEPLAIDDLPEVQALAEAEAATEGTGADSSETRTFVQCSGQLQGCPGASCARPSSTTRVVNGSVVPYCDECAASVGAEPAVSEAQVAADRDRARAKVAIAKARLAS